VAAGHISRKFDINATALIGEELGYFPAQQKLPGLFSDIAEVRNEGFGWRDELEAYRLASEYLVKANYDAYAIIEIYDLFSRPAKETFLIRSLPIHGVYKQSRDERKRLLQVIRNVAIPRKVRSDVVKRDQQFLSRLNGVLLGESANGGYRREPYNFHKGLGLALVTPKHWVSVYSPNMLLSYHPDQEACLSVTRIDDAAGEGIISKLKLLRDENNFTPFQILAHESGKIAWFSTESATVFGDNMVLFGIIEFNNGNVFLIQANAKEQRLWEEYYPIFQKVMGSITLWAEDSDPAAQPVELALLVARETGTLDTLLSGNKEYADADKNWIRYLNQLNELEYVEAGQYLKVTR
jgi:predicted Zn-dependent protease